MITEWENALNRQEFEVTLSKKCMGSELEEMRNDLIVYKSTEPVPIGNKEIELFLVDNLDGNGLYRVFPTYKSDGWWTAPPDERLGGADMLSNQLSMGSNEEEAVYSAEKQINKVFING